MDSKLLYVTITNFHMHSFFQMAAAKRNNKKERVLIRMIINSTHKLYLTFCLSPTFVPQVMNFPGGGGGGEGPVASLRTNLCNQEIEIVQPFWHCTTSHLIFEK